MLFALRPVFYNRRSKPLSDLATFYISATLRTLWERLVAKVDGDAYRWTSYAIHWALLKKLRIVRFGTLNYFFSWENHFKASRPTVVPKEPWSEFLRFFLGIFLSSKFSTTHIEKFKITNWGSNEHHPKGKASNYSENAEDINNVIFLEIQNSDALWKLLH